MKMYIRSQSSMLNFISHLFFFIPLFPSLQTLSVITNPMSWTHDRDFTELYWLSILNSQCLFFFFCLNLVISLNVFEIKSNIKFLCLYLTENVGNIFIFPNRKCKYSSVGTIKVIS